MTFILSRSLPSFFALVALFGLFTARTAFSQISPEEHASHHGGESPGVSPQVPGPPAGGMMQGMGEMMKGMGVPPAKELYPSLMELPDLPREKWEEVQAKAHSRMQSGMDLLSRGIADLSNSWQADDFSQMQSAAELMREGLSEFQSGLATHRLLAEGESPKNVALSWFKREMNILPTETADREKKFFGFSIFHFVVMTILVMFSASMVAMYFFKMHRAAFLLERLTSPGRPEERRSPEKGGGSAPLRISTPALIIDESGRGEGGSQAQESKLDTMIEKDLPLSLERWAGKLKLAAVFQETPTVRTFRFVNPNGGSIPFNYLPGQFMTLAVTIGGKVVKRSYTIASSPTQRYYYELTIKREEKGLVSPYLHDHLKRDSLIDVAGPGGVFTFTGTEANSIVLIGAGVGITPHMSIIRYLTDRCWEGKIYLLYACRTPADIIFQNELGELQARNPNLQQYITVTRAEGTTWSGLRGYFSKQSIALCIPDIVSTRVHLCGPVAMMDGVKTVLAELGVPKSSVKTENFGPVKRGGAEILAERRAPESIVSTSTTVTFKTSGKNAFLPPRLTVLEAAESVGVEIENSCRSGTCGICKVKLLEGAVTMDIDDALSEKEKAQGIILACQARATANIVVEA